MSNRRLSLFVLVSALGVGLAGAQPDRVESPQKAVKRVAKAFGKLRSYQLAASVSRSSGVEAGGGRVERVPLVEGWSTTRLVGEIVERLKLQSRGRGENG